VALTIYPRQSHILKVRERGVEAPGSSVTMALWQGLMAQVRHLVTLVVGNTWGIGAVPPRRERLG